MKLNFKLSLIVLIIVAAVAVVLLERSSSLTIGLNTDAIKYIGGVGCLLDISAIQQGVEQIMKENEIISAMSIYDNTGFILASCVPDRVDKMLLDVDTIYGGHLQDVQRAVERGEPMTLSSCTSVNQVNEISGRNREGIDTLMREVQKFKVE